MLANGETDDFSGGDFVKSPQCTLTAGATWQRDNGIIANINANDQTDSLAVINPYISSAYDLPSKFNPKKMPAY